MHRPTRARGFAALVAIGLLVAACGSSSTPAATAPGASSPASTAPAASLPAGPASAAPSAAPDASSAASAAPAASSSTTGAVAQPSGSPCDWLDKATIDASLGLSVGNPIGNTGDAKGRICTWLSKVPVGGITLAILSSEEVNGLLAAYQSLPGGRLVPGLGVKAGALFVTDQKAPLAKSHAQVFVDYGGWALSVDVSGPDVTVDEAAALAAAAVIP